MVARRYAMGVFRRRTADPPEVPEADQQAAEPAAEAPRPSHPNVTQAKGRPTPKRSESERKRQPFGAPPASMKPGGQQSRGQDRGDRARRQEAMKRGEEWALLPKDRGKVRKFVRDYVDARRGISEYYIFALLFFAVLLFIPALHSSTILIYAVWVLLIVMVIESVLLGNRVVKQVQQRFPGESTRGLRWYAASRGAMLRRMRIPAPQVKPGEKV